MSNTSMRNSANGKLVKKVENERRYPPAVRTLRSKLYPRSTSRVSPMTC